MSSYRIFFVGTANFKPGKRSEAIKWYREIGQEFFAAYPGVKSLQVYASQFGLGRKYGLEFWFEIEDYGVMDRWDADMEANPEKYAPWAEFAEYFESGPSHIMGDWPESSILD